MFLYTLYAAFTLVHHTLTLFVDKVNCYFIFKNFFPAPALSMQRKAAFRMHHRHMCVN